MKTLRKILPVLLLLLAVLILLPPARENGTPASTAQQTESLSLLPTGSSPESEAEAAAQPEESGTADGQNDQKELPEDGSYTTKEDVAQYLIRYGHLPGNFVTKAEARKAGWNGGNLQKILPGKYIGGDSFGNQEGLLPKAKGRSWRECDINTLGQKSRGSERLIWSNDGLIYYTDDHYESFTLLYSPYES
ncbi:MAG: ribonuclease [Oscillospiraceae bacterium]|nr:ribonuclease [Oscillospiraceae bacterium]